MELISNICIVLMFVTLILASLSLLLLPISLLIYIILRCCKAKSKRTFGLITLGLLCALLVFSISVCPLSLISAMTDPSTWCEHKYEIVNQINATCNTDGNITKRCSECGDEISETVDKLGHAWVETVKEPSCTEHGERTKTCSSCGITTSEVIEAHHKYIETIISEPKCETIGIAQDICSVCGNTQNKSIPSTGHTWNNATCISPKICSKCNAQSGDPIGHTTDAGVCSRCNETIKKQSPITVVGMRYTIDFLGGVEWTFKIRNNTDKEIKYITFQWTCYNAVGDPIRDDISGKTYVRIKYTGPLAPGETSNEKRNATPFYNSTYTNMSWNEITVEYMDGTTETITEYYEDYYQQ